MKTITAKEAKNRLGQAIDTALAEGIVMITKNGRESVALVSAERLRQLTGVQEFIKDENATQKNGRREAFTHRVNLGLSTAADASMFHGLATKSKVHFLSEEY